jgi:FKBP-type peptidyl-prolyl cis-trans isomerase
MEANKRVVKTEAQHIEDFLRRYKWDMTETGSGLLYMIYEQGHGMLARKGMMAKVSYEIKVVTGDVVYSSIEDGPLSFIIGNGEVISGLEEGILFMNVGDKAKFIIPSHLAYGLVGDGKRIPAKTTLIYDVELLSITESN